MNSLFLNLNSPLPLHARIRDVVRKQILDGAYEHHAKIPSEKELMDEFGVSRITVRHALSALEKEGLVFKIAGKGCFVSKPKPTQSLVKLQGFAEAMAPKGYKAFNRVIGSQIVNASNRVAELFRIETGTPVVQIQRVRFLDQAPVSFDITYLLLEVGNRIIHEDLATRDIFSIFENDYSTPLGFADLKIEATLADHQMADHLQVAENSPLLFIERMTFTKSGTPLELDYVYYRADRFRYELRIERE